MRKKLAIIAASLLVFSKTFAVEIQTSRRRGKLQVTLKNLNLPETFAKDLNSGLTTKLLVRIDVRTLKPGTAEGFTPKQIELSAKYDLWTEKYRFTTRDESGESATTITSVAELLSKFNELHVSDITPLNAAATDVGSEISIHYDALLNPVEREKMERIKNWVMQNSTSSPGDATSVGSGRAVSAARRNTLFNHIFEQLATGGSVAAAWRENGESKPIKFSDVPNEK